MSGAAVCAAGRAGRRMAQLQQRPARAALLAAEADRCHQRRAAGRGVPRADRRARLLPCRAGRRRATPSTRATPRETVALDATNCAAALEVRLPARGGQLRRFEPRRGADGRARLSRHLRRAADRAGCGDRQVAVEERDRLAAARRRHRGRAAGCGTAWCTWASAAASWACVAGWWRSMPRRDASCGASTRFRWATRPARKPGRSPRPPRPAAAACGARCRWM